MKRCDEIRNENKELSKIGKKRCTRCEKIYDKNSKFFHVRSKKYLRAFCKSCDSKRISNLKERICKDPEWYCKKIISSLKNRAKTNKVPFNLTWENLYSKLKTQEFKCYYTGKYLDFTLKGTKTPHRNFPSVDRLIPSLGYTKGNIAWCTCIVNRMKSDLTETEFIQFCKTVIVNS